MKRNTLLTFSVGPAHLTACQRAAAEARESEAVDGLPVRGIYVPQCDATGNYVPLQRHASTGHRWCVDEHGREITGTNTPPGKPDPDCVYSPGNNNQ